MQMSSNTTVDKQNNCPLSLDGPFQATRLWNQIICDFSCGIKAKRHRRHLRLYSNCFMASKAVDWLHCYLMDHKPCPDKPIIRNQAIQLLEKFLQYNIIEKVIYKEPDALHFKDNKELYRLKTENIPYQCEKSGNGHSFYDHHRHNGQVDSNHMTRSMSLCSPADSSSVDSSQPVMKTSVSLPPASFQRPMDESIHSVVGEFNSTGTSSAWKEVVLSHLAAIQPHFSKLIDTKMIDEDHIYINANRISKNGVVIVDDKSKDVPHWVMSAMRCLVNWPNGANGSMPRYDGFERDVFNLIREYFVNLGSSLIPHKFYPLIISLVGEADQQRVARLRSRYLGCLDTDQPDSCSVATNGFTHHSIPSGSPLSHSEQPHHHRKDCKHKKEQVFETVFMPGSSITRILSYDQLTSFFANFSTSDGSLDDRPISPDDPNSSNSYGCRILDARKLQHIATLPRLIKKQRLEGAMNRANSFRQKPIPNKPALGSTNVGFVLQSPSEEGEYMMDKSLSPLNTYRPLKTIHLNMHNSLSSSSIISRDSLEYSKNIELLSLVLLMIPPENRRHLHLLLRLFTRVTRNKELKIFSKTFSNIEYYLIETFTRCIIYSGYEKTYNETAAQYLVSVLLNNTEDIFTVPNFLKSQVCHNHDHHKTHSK
ncbi:DEP domain-containing protein 1A-like [Brevipalpus obovatus]|uniref:DEP domain-containing protein 1A-like n=1 Tax=Brevipalpus obovatus TaxID=246614 RepID=UPI003D9E5734